jgi:membrane-bound lytic murein transglycosylase F
MFKVLPVAAVFLIVVSCTPPIEEPVVTIDLPEIAERGYLRAITSYSLFSYFIYQGEPMGYEYEMLQMLSERLGMPVHIMIARDFEEMEALLEEGEGDLIAYNLTITSERRERMAFTEPMNITRQVLVQRKPENWHHLLAHQIDARLLRSPVELKDVTIHVRKGSSYASRLRNLSGEIGGTINIVEAPAGITTEELIRQVADGIIDYTVSDENIARIKAAYHRNLDVQTPISLHQQTAWAARKSSPLLLELVNEWLESAQKRPDYHVIYRKYYEDRRNFITRYTSEFFPLLGDAISAYDDKLREGSEKLGWDWRLLAALTFKESRFDPHALSWAGAAGLMQLMPATAEQFGAMDPFDPEQNIEAGTSYLRWLDGYWKDIIEDEEERIKFIIASYNVGYGHIQDARRLAMAFGADPDRWDGNVARFLLKKSNPDYYNMDIVRHGYANGIEPVTFVDTIYDLYAHYCKFID